VSRRPEQKNVPSQIPVFFDTLEAGIADIFENVRIADRGAPFRDLDVAPTFERFRYR
jgi:hypothetical protein